MEDASSGRARRGTLVRSKALSGAGMTASRSIDSLSEAISPYVSLGEGARRLLGMASVLEAFGLRLRFRDGVPLSDASLRAAELSAASGACEASCGEEGTGGGLASRPTSGSVERDGGGAALSPETLSVKVG